MPSAIDLLHIGSWCDAWIDAELPQPLTTSSNPTVPNPSTKTSLVPSRRLEPQGRNYINLLEADFDSEHSLRVGDMLSTVQSNGAHHDLGPMRRWGIETKSEQPWVAFGRFTKNDRILNTVTAAQGQLKKGGSRL